MIVLGASMLRSFTLATWGDDQQLDAGVVVGVLLEVVDDVLVVGLLAVHPLAEAVLQGDAELVAADDRAAEAAAGILRDETGLASGAVFR